jgi:predicted DNA-binding transcriptional regulator AlpA
MIVFPPDHPLGRQQRDLLREKLFPAGDRDELVRLHGELILPALTELLDAKVEKLAAQYEKAWKAAFATLKEDDSAVLIPREQVAELLGCSISTVQRLEKSGKLPKPQRYGHRTVRHRLGDIRAFAQTLAKARPAVGRDCADGA